MLCVLSNAAAGIKETCCLIQLLYPIVASTFGSPIEIVSHFFSSAALICKSAAFSVALFCCAYSIAWIKLKLKSAF